MHGNARENPNLHHLYCIFKLEGRETFKFGISDDPIDPEDALSTRVREQVEEWNLAAEYIKFGAEILVRDIAGREVALRLERHAIDAYYEKNGKNPPGNKFPKRK